MIEKSQATRTTLCSLWYTRNVG